MERPRPPAASRRPPPPPLPPELDPRPRHARTPVAPAGRRRAAPHRAVRRRAWHRRLALSTRLLAALLSFSVLLVSGYAWSTYHNFVSSVRHVDAITSKQPGQRGSGAGDQNILLVGDDDRTNATPAELAVMHTGQDGGGINTDTMIVLHVPGDGSRATGISLPRDSWVNIPGFGMNKLNAAYEFGTQNGGGPAGGARLLIRMIQSITGLHIDHFVMVSMLGFYRIATVLGPIQVCLTHPAQDSYSGIDLPAGISTLDASQALSFVRQRHNLPRGDLDREVRQQYFLSTEFRKLTQAGTLLNPFKLQKLLGAVSSSITTDPGLNLLSFAHQVQNLSAGKVKFATIPVRGTPTITYNGNQVSIVQLDTAAIPGFIDTVLGQPGAYTRAGTVDPATVRVQVLNGGAANGAAVAATTLLGRDGFAVAQPANTSQTAATRIEYPAGMEAQAKTLARYVPAAIPVASTTVTTVTLVLGSDGHTVASTPSPTGTATSPHPRPPAVPATSPGAAQAYSQHSCIN